MVAKFVSIDHDSPLLLPPDLRDWLPSDHMVHFIMDAINALDLSAARVNILIGYLSHAGGSHPGGFTPFLASGDINGNLKTGRHLNFSGKGHAEHRTAANFYLSLLHAAGKPRDNFAVKDAALTSNQDGPLAQLMV